MRRGTTPTITIQTDLDLTGYTVFVTISQGAIQKDFVPIVTPTELMFDLTQADTLAFKDGAAKLQIRAVDAEGYAIASNIMTINVREILKEGIIAYGDS